MTALNKNKNKIILALCVLIGLSGASFFAVSSAIADTAEITQLNDKISNKKNEISSLQEKIDSYTRNIKAMQKEAKSLNDEISILENEIAKVNLSIEATNKMIEETNLEIQNTNLQIKETEGKIIDAKEKVAQYLRLIYTNDQVSYLEVILTNDSFSDFFDQIKYAQDIHTNLKNALVKYKSAKMELDMQKSNLEEKVAQEESLKDELLKQKAELDEKNTARELILVQTRMTERKYQNWVYQLQLEQQQINADIVGLEKNIRKKMEELEKENRFKNLGPARLGWPVSPARGITAYFHDPDYPFRYIFEHPGIDIRAYQGTPIQAPENGYVARVKFAGNTSYAYIMIIHNEGISTVFGHVSAVYVKEDQYVNKGETVGLSGGMPGSVGAGNLSTGPHLHFEVRLNGIPVNPLEYLPAI